MTALASPVEVLIVAVVAVVFLPWLVYGVLTRGDER